MDTHEHEQIDRIAQLTREGCIQELKGETSRNILGALVIARKQLKRMRVRGSSGQVQIFVQDGVIRTVVGPDSMQPPTDN